MTPVQSGEIRRRECSPRLSVGEHEFDLGNPSACGYGVPCRDFCDLVLPWRPTVGDVGNVGRVKSNRASSSALQGNGLRPRTVGS